MRNLTISVGALELVVMELEVRAAVEVVGVMLYMVKVNMVSATVVKVDVMYMTISTRVPPPSTHGCAGSVVMIVAKMDEPRL